ncbi:MAG: hypothetical protein AAF639_35785 [Chloroflexota bacterium]
MLTSITVNAHHVGHRQNSIEDTTFGIPLGDDTDSGYITLAELIRHIVTVEVQGFEERQQKRRFYPLLTAQEIRRGAAKGKVNAAVNDEPQQVVDIEAVVANAHQSFVDGLYFLFVDDVQYSNLSDTVFISPGAVVSFIRLVALAGG